MSPDWLRPTAYPTCLGAPGAITRQPRAKWRRQSRRPTQGVACRCAPAGLRVPEASCSPRARSRRNLYREAPFPRSCQDRHKHGDNRSTSRNSALRSIYRNSNGRISLGRRSLSQLTCRQKMNVVEKNGRALIFIAPLVIALLVVWVIYDPFHMTRNAGGEPFFATLPVWLWVIGVGLLGSLLCYGILRTGRRSRTEADMTQQATR